MNLIEFEGLSMQDCAKKVADNALFYREQREGVLLENARKYNVDLVACGKQSLGISSPEVDKCWASGEKFWEAFLAYATRVLHSQHP